MSSKERYTDYDTWAWLYNQTMGPEYGKSQLQWLERVLFPDLPSSASLLDLCCGTGQLIPPLSARGYRVTGLDGSQAMLNYAKENAPTAEFWLDDARTFSSPIQFDAVFSTSASLNHVMSLAELTQVFENVYAALKFGGIFLFDLNHPGQMQKWWRGQIAEGEIHLDYAWMLSPHYNSEERQGVFKVSIFEALPQTPNSKFKTLLYKLLSLRRLTRFRLKLLSRFSDIEPNWKRSDLDYWVKGHEVEEVQEALTQVGFEPIRLETIEGSPTLDNNHSAHFIAYKTS